MEMEKVKQYLELRAKRKALEAEAKALGEQEDTLADQIAGQFVADGLSSIKCDGQTVYLATELSCSCLGDTARVLAAAREETLDGALATVNHQRLRALVNEIGKDRFFEQHPAFVGALEISERPVIRSRKA